MVKKISLLFIIAGFIFSFFYYDLYQYLTLDYLKSKQNDLMTMIDHNYYHSIFIFMTIYIGATALSLPGAAILTLAAGALFGLLEGTILVSFASTIGATLAFLTSRFLLRDWVQAKFRDKLKTINQGIKEEGSFYLFTLRLVPVVPFFIINLVMGLTKIRTLTFFFVSQIGMLAGTLVYVNAGTQLSQIDSLSGILSPKLLLSFVVLGIFPLAAKKIIALFRR
jgi:uncharacterized membrane protein YdjX (TVP38/TMEM64 family)